MKYDLDLDAWTATIINLIILPLILHIFNLQYQFKSMNQILNKEIHIGTFP